MNEWTIEQMNDRFSSGAVEELKSSCFFTIFYARKQEDLENRKRRAVKKFQQDAGLQPVDGIVGPRTWGVLCEIMTSVVAAPIQQQPQRDNYIKCAPPNNNPTLDFIPKNKCKEYRNLEWN